MQPIRNPLLIEANLLFSQGEYSVAAIKYEQLARMILSHQGDLAHPEFGFKQADAIS
jgi:hypothetical protein